MTRLPPSVAPALALVLAAAGCAPVLSTMQPASVHDGVHVGVGLDGSVAPGVIADAIELGDRLGTEVGQGGTLDEGDLAALYDAAAKVLVGLPGVGGQLVGAYGWNGRYEVGLRLASSAIRVGARWQFLRDEHHGIDASIGLGLSAYTAGAVAELFDVVKIGDPTRGELDVPLLFGWSNDIGHLWFGGKLQMTGFDYATSIDTGSETLTLVNFGGSSRYLGLQVGGAIGFRWVWLAAELTVARLSADVTLDVFEGTSRDLAFSATVVAPSIGVMGRF